MKILKKHNLLKSEIEFKEKDKFYTFLIDEYGYEDRTARTQENIKNMKMLEFINKEMTLKQMTKDKIEKEKKLKILNLTNIQDKEEGKNNSDEKSAKIDLDIELDDLIKDQLEEIRNENIKKLKRQVKEIDEVMKKDEIINNENSKIVNVENQNNESKTLDLIIYDNNNMIVKLKSEKKISEEILDVSQNQPEILTEPNQLFLENLEEHIESTISTDLVWHDSFLSLIEDKEVFETKKNNTNKRFA